MITLSYGLCLWNRAASYSLLWRLCGTAHYFEADSRRTSDQGWSTCYRTCKKLQKTWWEISVWSLKKAQRADLLELWAIFSQGLWRSVRVNQRFLVTSAGGRGTSFWSDKTSFLLSDISGDDLFRCQLRWFRHSQQGLLLLVLREGMSRWGKPVDLDVWDMGVFWLGSVNKLWTSLNSLKSIWRK